MIPRYEDNYLILQLNISVKVSEDCSWCSIFKDKYLSQRSNRVKGMNEMQMNKEIFYFHFWYIFFPSVTYNLHVVGVNVSVGSSTQLNDLVPVRERLSASDANESLLWRLLGNRSSAT